MELTHQVTALQEEITLLKGEIKVILKEIRSAVLTRDNPFAADAAPPAFHPAERPGSDDSGDIDAEPDASEEEPDPGPTPLPTEDPGPPSTEGPGPPPAGGPGPPPGAGPGAPPVVDPKEPTPLRPIANAPSAEPPDEHWNLLTIASLAAWAEDSLTALGHKRFQFVLELASFSDLVSPEVQEVLCSVAKFAPPRENDDRPMNINECLVVLRQLEAILQGEKVTRLPRRRRTRHSRVR